MMMNSLNEKNPEDCNGNSISVEFARLVMTFCIKSNNNSSVNNRIENNVVFNQNGQGGLKMYTEIESLKDMNHIL